ncbi:MAG: hypothetical protein ACPGYY_07155 [Bacteroidia bacterium]
MRFVQLVLFTFVTFIVYANKPIKRIAPPTTEIVPLSLSTFSINGVNIGLKVGSEWNLAEVRKYKKTWFRRKSKLISKQLLLNGSIAYGLQPTTNSNWLTAVEMGRRRTRNNKWEVTPSLGIGLLVKRNLGETWEVDELNGPENIGKSSRAYLSTTLSYTIGRKVSLSSGAFMSPHLRVSSYSAVAMNSTLVPELALEIGVRFEPKWSKSRTIHKTIYK